MSDFQKVEHRSNPISSIDFKWRLSTSHNQLEQFQNSFPNITLNKLQEKNAKLYNNLFRSLLTDVYSQYLANGHTERDSDSFPSSIDVT